MQRESQLNKICPTIPTTRFYVNINNRAKKSTQNGNQKINAKESFIAHHDKILYAGIVNCDIFTTVDTNGMICLWKYDLTYFQINGYKPCFSGQLDIEYSTYAPISERSKSPDNLNDLSYEELFDRAVFVDNRKIVPSVQTAFYLKGETISKNTYKFNILSFNQLNQLIKKETQSFQGKLIKVLL